MALKDIGSPNHGSDPPRLHSHSGIRGWWIAAVALLIVAGAVGAFALFRAPNPNSAPIGGRTAAIGNELFNRAAARCGLRPDAGHAAGSQQSSLLLGLSAGLRLFQGRARCSEARLAQATGVQAVRDDISWAKTEPEPNHYNWTDYDGVVRTATEAGLTLLPVIDDSPRWAAPTSASLPSHPEPYAAFIAAVVARYSAGGSFWKTNPQLPERPLVWYELWNEPYYADANRDPATYARLVVAAVSAGRAANRAARFLIEGTTGYQTSSGDRADWIEGMYAAVPNLGSYFDGLAIHPYGGDPAIDTPIGNTDNEPAVRVAQAHGELAARGDGGKPLWVTEIGWSTCSGAESCVSEAQQAAYLRTFLRLASTTWRSYVRAVFVFSLRDLAPNPPDNRDAWFGLLRPDLTHKPAWYVLHEAANGTP